MAYKGWEVALGGAVMVVAAGFVWFAVETAGTQLRSPETYALSANFSSAEGVRPGTEVRMAGVRVGRVQDMALDPTSLTARVGVAINAGIAIPEDSTLAVASESLLGGIFLEIVPGGAPFDLAPGDQFFDTQSAVSLTTLLLRFVTGGSTDGDGGSDDPDTGALE
jgi:phospholipid/cholesterol/gamma-HCH transport system substrate-binding protein